MSGNFLLMDMWLMGALSAFTVSATRYASRNDDRTLVDGPTFPGLIYDPSRRDGWYLNVRDRFCPPSIT
jgi:hypothetical protein